MDELKEARSMVTRLWASLKKTLNVPPLRRPYADLHGQVALVTGGSRGLGLLLARELRDAGCSLVLCARNEAELDRARAILTRDERDPIRTGADIVDGAPSPGELEVLTVPCDVTNRTQIKAMLAQVMKRFGRIDILVNNAGIIQVTPLANTVRADFESALDTMFWGMHDVTMAVLPGMLERGYGRIVNVTSLGGKVSVPHLLPYSTAKFAAVGFSEGLRAELAGKNVTVTTVVPGLMRTGSITNVLVKGNKQAEIGWFAVLGSLPLLSMDANRAARLIVRALRRGTAEAVIGLPAKLAVRGNALFPNLTAGAVGLVGRLLPDPVAGNDLFAKLSRDVAGALDQPLIRLLTILSRQAAARNNEMPEERS